MSDKIKRNALVGVLSKIKPALSTQDFLPVLSCFCFNEDTIYAYNDVMAISFPNEIDFPFEGAIPGDRLIKVLNSLKSEDISCKVKDNSVKISSGKSNIKLPFLDEDDFIWEMPSNDCKVDMPIDKDFINGLKLCLISIGQDAMHPEHMGIQLSGEDGECYMHSTDNTTISRYVLEGECDDFSPVILPEMFCQQVIALFGDMDDPCLYIRDDGMHVLDEETGIVIFSKYIYSGEGTDFSKTIDQYYSKSFKGTFNTIQDSGLIDALERALIVVGDNGDTSANLSKGILKLKTQTDNGCVDDEIKFSKDKSKVEVSFSTDLVLRACKILDKISLTKDIILFKSKSFIHLVAPRG